MMKKSPFKFPFNEKTRVTWVLLALLVGMVLVFSWTSESFLSRRNFLNIMRQTAETGMIVITVAFLVLSRDIDISMGSALGFCCIVLGLMLKSGVDMYQAGFLTILTGAVMGAFSGFLVAGLKLQGMVASAGLLILLRGLCYVLTKGYPVSGFSDEFLALGRLRFWNVLPLSFTALIVIVVIAHIIMEKTNIGLQITVLGANRTTAKFSGIGVDRIKFLLFTANGMMIGFASFFLLSRMASAEATTGQGYDLDILASCLLGGLSLSGSKGNILSVFLGLMNIGIMRNGFNQLAIPAIYQDIVLGVVIALNAANWVRARRE
ncbi:MAG: ABC transporter permease [Synergistaceae bacterium]|jgi:ribose transport system permease protein|nr:ABC transporter permease [Synergistaceae bacterium]